MKYRDKLYQRYHAEIKNWDWTAIRADAAANPQKDYEGEIRHETYLGSVLSLYPSGKYYMPWTTNQTARDVIRDDAYQRALDDVAEEHGMYVTSGEGDPCDVFVGY